MDERSLLKRVRPALARITDPISGDSVWLTGLFRRARVEDGVLRLDFAPTPQHTQPIRDRMVAEVQAALAGEGVSIPIEIGAVTPGPGAAVKGMDGPGVEPHGGALERVPLPGIKHVLAVGSAKGGVGKSTVAANLAIALQRAGVRVGLLDADIHGPSVHLMMGATGRPAVGSDRRIRPHVAHGVPCMSVGFVVDPEEAMIWRGPMVMGALSQLLTQTAWGELDVLVVDLPPGTGDAQLTLVQSVALSGAVIVTTPQDLAVADAIRGIAMFRQLGVPLLGVVENMAYYVRMDGSRDHVFGKDGARRAAERFNTEVLVQLPLHSEYGATSETGRPIALGDSPRARPFVDLADRVRRKLGI